MKRIFVLLTVLILGTMLAPARSDAGVLRALGHTGMSVLRGTGHFGKSLAHDVARDFYEWIY
jgi:hypothetical protein